MKLLYMSIISAGNFNCRFVRLHLRDDVQGYKIDGEKEECVVWIWSTQG